LHTIVVARLRDDSQTRAYAARRKRAEGKSPKEALRCLKRVVARQLLKLLERCDRAAVELSVLPEVLLVTVRSQMSWTRAARRDLKAGTSVEDMDLRLDAGPRRRLPRMSKRFSWLWQQLGAWRQRQRARRQEQRQRQRELNRRLWGGPVEADRVLAFSDAIFAIAITLLTLNLEVRPGLHGAEFTRALQQVLPALGAYVLSFVILGQLWLAHHRIFGVIARVDYAVLVRNLLFLGLIAIMPFPVRLLSDYTRRPLAVAIYAVAFISAMQLQRLIWLDVTRPEHRELLREPVPEEVRAGFGRVLLGLLVVFGAAVPVGMFAPRYATLVWAVIIPLRLVVARLTNWPSWRPSGI
jgi:uncharacterized membrane protein